MKHMINFIVVLLLVAATNAWAGQPTDTSGEVVIEMRGTNVHVFQQSTGVLIGPPVSLVSDAQDQLATVSDDGRSVLVRIVWDSQPEQTRVAVCGELTRGDLLPGYTAQDRIQPIQASKISLETNDIYGLQGSMNPGPLTGQGVIPVHLPIKDAEKARAFVRDFNQGKALLTLRYMFKAKEKQQYLFRYSVNMSDSLMKALDLDGTDTTEILVSRHQISEILKDVVASARVEVTRDGKKAEPPSDGNKFDIGQNVLKNMLDAAVDWEKTHGFNELGWDLNDFKANVIKGLSTVTNETTRNLVHEELKRLTQSKNDVEGKYSSSGKVTGVSEGETEVNVHVIKEDARAEAEKYLTDFVRKYSKTSNFIGEWRIGLGLDLVRLDIAKLQKAVAYEHVETDLEDVTREVFITLTADNVMAENISSTVVSQECLADASTLLATSIVSNGCVGVTSCHYVSPGKNEKVKWHGKHSYEWLVIAEGGSLKTDTGGKDLTLHVKNAVIAGELRIISDGKKGPRARINGHGSDGENAGAVTLELGALHNPLDEHSLSEQEQLARIKVSAIGGEGRDGRDGKDARCHQGLKIYVGKPKTKHIRVATAGGNGGLGGNGGDVSITLGDDTVTTRASVSAKAGKPGLRGRGGLGAICEMRMWFIGTTHTYELSGANPGQPGSPGEEGQT